MLSAAIVIGALRVKQVFGSAVAANTASSRKVIALFVGSFEFFYFIESSENDEIRQYFR